MEDKNNNEAAWFSSTDEIIVSSEAMEQIIYLVENPPEPTETLKNAIERRAYKDNTTYKLDKDGTLAYVQFINGKFRVEHCVFNESALKGNDKFLNYKKARDEFKSSAVRIKGDLYTSCFIQSFSSPSALVSCLLGGNYSGPRYLQGPLDDNESVEILSQIKEYKKPQINISTEVNLDHSPTKALKEWLLFVFTKIKSLFK